MMRQYLLLVIVIFQFLPLTGKGQAVIRGKAPSYAGYELNIYQYTERITMHEKCIAKTIVDSLGNFRLNLPVDDTCFVFTHLGIFKGFLYVVPGMEYKVILPKKTDKKIEDKLNPYFKEEKIHLNLKGWGKINNNLDTAGHELNHLINSFDYLTDKFIINLAQRLYTETNKSKLDSVINRINDLFTVYENSFFQDYKTYKIAVLKHMVYKYKKPIINTLYKNKPVLYNNPAYMDLFNLLYGDFFTQFAQYENSDTLGKHILNTDIDKVKNYLIKNKYFVNNTLCELAILKGIYDGLYAKAYQEQFLLNLLDSINANSKIPVNREIASNIKSNFNKIKKGEKPPHFELFDQDSNLITIDSLAGNYVYLNFCNPESYTCLEHFQILKTYHERFGDQLKIVTLFFADQRETMDQFIKKHHYKWLFLFCNTGSGLSKKYNVEAYPTYFFLNKNGRLIFSHAPTPEDHFEKIFYNYLKNKGDI